MFVLPKRASQEKILVVDATGAIGAKVLENLKQEGVSARAAARLLPDAARRPRGEWVPFDFAWPATYPRALHGMGQAFLSLPIQPAVPQWTKEFLKAARESGLRRVVQLTTAGIAWHREAEKSLRESGLDYVILRAASRMQDFGERHARQIRERGVFPSRFGEARVAHVDADDIAAAAVAALVRGDLLQSEYNLTGPAAILDAEIAWILSVFTGSEIVCRGMDSEALPREQAEFLRQGGARNLTTDLRALLDRPARPFADYIERQLALFQPAAATPIDIARCSF